MARKWLSDSLSTAFWIRTVIFTGDYCCRGQPSWCIRLCSRRRLSDTDSSGAPNCRHKSIAQIRIYWPIAWSIRRRINDAAPSRACPRIADHATGSGPHRNRNWSRLGDVTNACHIRERRIRAAWPLDGVSVCVHGGAAGAARPARRSPNAFSTMPNCAPMTSQYDCSTRVVWDARDVNVTYARPPTAAAAADDDDADSRCQYITEMADRKH